MHLRLGNVSQYRPSPTLRCAKNGPPRRTYVYTISEDCNENGIPDASDLPGDFDADADVDLADFEHFHSGMTAPNPGALPSGRCFFDFELYHDVDLGDCRLFQLAFSTSGTRLK